MKNLAGLQIALVISTIAGCAFAQEATERSFGRSGQVALSAERLFGVTSASESDSDRTFTTISLIGGSGYAIGTEPYNIPRLAIDGFITDGLSIGAGANFANLSRSSGSSDSVTLFGFYPRIGYALSVSHGFTFWPRAGISYLGVDSGESAHLMAATFEAQCVITGPHVGFTFAPVADVGIDGTDGQKITQLGVQAGLIGWL